MTSNWVRKSRTVAAILALVSGGALAAHYAFSISDFWSNIPDENESAVQTRAGQLNVAKKQGDTVTARFTANNPDLYGHFWRKFLASTNAFEQIGGPCTNPACTGGGGCSVVSPSSSALTLDGVVVALGTGLARELTMLGTADDGSQFVLDQFAVVSADDTPTMATYGFSSASATSLTLDFVQSAYPSAQGASASNIPAQGMKVLLIHHQGQHPPNHRFTPTPNVKFKPQSHRIEAGVTLRGWGVVTFAKSGEAKTVRMLPADGGSTSPALSAKLLRGISGTFEDERRHLYSAYFVYEVANGLLSIKGKPFIALPMCCGTSCDPDPFDEIDVQCP